MPTNEYMTPEIGKVIPMLAQSCDELTRQALIRSLTEKTKEWVKGDPELADIFLGGSKTLEECVRYVTEKAAAVVAKNLNTMLDAEFSQLPKARIHGRDATMAGAAVGCEEVYKWALEYYYDPEAKPTDFKKEAERKAEAAAKKAAEAKNAAAKKGASSKKAASQSVDDSDDDSDGDEADAASAEVEAPAVTSKSAKRDKNAMDGGEQTSMFAPVKAA